MMRIAGAPSLDIETESSVRWPWMSKDLYRKKVGIWNTLLGGVRYKESQVDDMFVQYFKWNLTNSYLLLQCACATLNKSYISHSHLCTC